MDSRLTGDVVIRARAPLRISFGGGGTDVAPYADVRGGRVMNATINRYAYVTLRPKAISRANTAATSSNNKMVVLRSLDYDESIEYPLDSSPVVEAGLLRLAHGVVSRFADSIETGFEISTHVDCPPGSGLGASSTLVVALIGAMTRWLGIEMNPQEIAQTAFDIERVELGIKGGKQDQFAAAFGGFNFLEFDGGRTRVNPVRLDEEGIAELEYSLVLAYTGNSRASSDIIRDQIRNFESGDADATGAMDETRRVAYAMREALESGSFEDFGALLHEAWTAKKAMSQRITTPAIDAMYAAAREAGAMGGKISGAGGGGFAFFFCGFDKRDAVQQALLDRGADVVEFGFTNRGLQTWTR